MLAPADMNPLALEIAGPEQGVDFTMLVEINSEVQRQGNHLRVGDLVVQWNPYHQWNPSPNWSSVRKEQQEALKTLDNITSQLISARSPDSLAIFLSSSGLASDTRISGWQKRARVSITTLLNGLKTLDLEMMNSGVRELAGLGLGLTPSGDDFIVGVMHAIWLGTDTTQARPLCEGLLASASIRTNALSGSYMARAAMGEASLAWHTLVNAIAEADPTAIRSPVEDLIGLGHTSGQDALVGFLLGIIALQQT